MRGRAFPIDLFTRLAALPAAAGLEYLDIEGSNLESAHFSLMQSRASDFPFLRFLKLKAGNLDLAACKSVGAACQSLKSIELLDLGACASELDSANALALMQALGGESKLSRLGLRNLANDEAGRAGLFKALGAFEQLSELRLSARLHLACTQAIANMLADPNLSLKALDLEECAMDEASTLALAAGIRASRHLTEFRLAKIGFTDAGAHALGQAIGASTSLLEWTLDACDIEDIVQARALASALSCSASLREFHLKIEPDPQRARADVFRRVAQKFHGAAEQSTSLLHMNTGTEGFGSYQAQARLAENRKCLAAGLRY